MKRVLTAAVIAPAFVLFIWFGTSNAFAALSALLAAIVFAEFADMAKNKQIPVFKWRGAFSAGVLPLAFLSQSSVVLMVASLIVVALTIAAVAESDLGVNALVYTLFGIFYVGVAFTGAVLLRAQPEGGRLLLLICCATWGADVGAYYGGRNFGKTKLAPAISPNKTVEGLVAGVFSSALLAGLFAKFFFPHAVVPMVLGAALIGGLLGPVGDLAESMLKRFFGVKDSGKILPGHGGLFDRLDALMITAPVFYVFLGFAGYLA